ncbi:hypothetical protein SteCoe_6652 [Stentor coeruleus]|uniref:Uncharacterized protein n=1 Tax=Stentor coeruleus TaxID=5963 RepID=A0A1R2CPJ4_9CILI|nr:hypothetical protein SteCoe_6652 [Stentor coeruleus]
MSEAEEPLLPKTQTFEENEPYIENPSNQNPEFMSKELVKSGNSVEPPYIPSEDQANDCLTNLHQNPQESSLANHPSEVIIKEENPLKAFIRQSKCVFSVCSTIIIIAIIRYLYTKPRVFRYCYWDFSFTKAYKNIDSTAFNKDVYSISEFIEVACSNTNTISHCPDLCDSVKHLNLTEGVKNFCIIIGLFSIIGSLLYVIYMNFAKKKILKHFLHGVNCLALCVLVIGGFWYWFMSDIMGSFAEPDKINYDSNTFPEPYSFEILSVWMILTYLGFYLTLHEVIAYYTIK